LAKCRVTHFAVVRRIQCSICVAGFIDNTESRHNDVTAFATCTGISSAGEFIVTVPVCGAINTSTNFAQLWRDTSWACPTFANPIVTCVGSASAWWIATALTNTLVTGIGIAGAGRRALPGLAGGGPVLLDALLLAAIRRGGVAFTFGFAFCHPVVDTLALVLGTDIDDTVPGLAVVDDWAI
jgi:hypothetical protein